MARSLLVPDEEFPVRETDLTLDLTADPEAVYWLRPITVAKARELNDANTPMQFDKRTHQKVEVRDRDTRDAVNNAHLDYAIARWEGVMDKGQPAPCDLAHKLLLPLAVQVALVERAQVGQDHKAASFREPAVVSPVLGG